MTSPRQAQRMARRLASVLPLVLTAVMGLSLTAPAQTASFARAERVLSIGATAAYYGIAVGPAGDVYVAAGPAGIIEFPANAAPKVFYFHAGWGFNSVAVDPATGTVYASEGNGTSGQIDMIPAGYTPGGTLSVSQLSVDGTTAAQATQIYIANGKLYLAGQVGTTLGAPGVASVPLGGGASTVISTTAYSGVAADASGNVFVSSSIGGSVAVFLGGSGTATAITAATWSGPEQLAVDASGDLYVADDTAHVSNNGQLVKITDPAGASPVASQVVTPDATFAQVAPFGVAVDANGNVYWTNQGQTPPPNPVNVVGTTGASFLGQAVNGASGNTAFIFSITGTGTFGTPQVLTQGIAGGDFILGTDTCNGTLTGGTTCTVNVTFRPSSPGLKRGAVVLYNGSNAPVATAFVNGTGAGSEIAFAPARSTLSTTGANTLYINGLDTDGTYLYVTDNASIIRVNVAGGLANSGSFPLTGVESATDVKLDGAGNLWVADDGGVEEAVRQSDGTYAAFANKVYGRPTPAGLAVDASGNLFVTTGDGDSVVEYPAAAGDPITIAGASVCNGQCGGLGLDQAGNLYYIVAGVPHKVAANALSGAANPTATALTGVAAMSTLQFDAAGDLYTLSPSTGAIEEYASANGTLSTTPTAIVSNDGADVRGLALDANGNLYATDHGNALVVKYNAATPPTLAFGTQTNGGSATRSATLTNIGNAGLVFNLPALTFATGTMYTADASSTCAAGGTVSSGNSCTVVVKFSPTVAGAANDTLTISSSATPAPGTLTLTGTGVSTPPVIALTTSGTLTYGTAGAVNVTASGPAGTPTGTIAWTLDGTPQPGVALDSGGSATLPLPATLAAGNHTVAVTYPGDSSYSSLAGDTSESHTFPVAQAPVTVTIVNTPTKSYDGTQLATLTQANYGFAGIIPADTAKLGLSSYPGTGLYNSANAADANQVVTSVSALTLTGTAAGNYTLVNAGGNAFGPGIITKAALGVTASSATIIQGAALPAITGTVTSGQLFTSDTLASIGITCSASASDSGTAGIFPTTCAGAPANYAPVPTAGRLIIEPASPVVPATTVGQTSASFPVNFLFSADTTVSSVSVVSGGASDYASTDSSACVGTFTAGQLCTIHLTFTPGAPGGRMGAVVLNASAGGALQTAYFSGNGLGARIASPSSDGWNTSSTAATILAADAQGNLYTYAPAAGVVKVVDGELQTISNVGTAPSGIAVGGDGTVYGAIPTGVAVLGASGWTVVASGSPAAIGVDGAGNVYYTDAASVIHVLAPGGAASTLGTGIDPNSPLAVDPAGNVYATANKETEVMRLSPGADPAIAASGLSGVNGIAVDAGGNLYLTTSTGIEEVTASGSQFSLSSDGARPANAITLDHFGDLASSWQGKLERYTLGAASGAALTFNPAEIGLPSTMTRTFLNAGSTPLTFSAITITGDSAEFELDPKSTCATTAAVAPGATCDLVVAFTPPAGASTHPGTLTLTSNSVSDGAVGIALSGTGVAPGVWFGVANPPPNAPAATLTFPPTAVNASSTAAATLTYLGTVPLPISISASDGFAVDPKTTSCGTALQPSTPPGDSTACTIGLTATPSTPGTMTGLLTVTDSIGTQTLPLTVVGVAPSASLSVHQLNFGGIPVGASSDAQSLELVNYGTAPLTGITVATSSGFTVTTDNGTGTACGGPLAAGQSCGIHVSFAPQTAGAQTGTLTVTDSAGTQSVELSGTGQLTGLAFTPAIVHVQTNFIYYLFNALHLNLFTITANATLKNIGLTPLTPSFSPQPRDGSCGSLAPGQSCTLTWTVNDGTTPIVASAGAAQATALVVTDTSLFSAGSAIWGATPVGGKSSATTITVLAAFVGGPPTLTDPNNFSILSSDCPALATAAPASPFCTVTVDFEPKTTGAISGKLDFHSLFLPAYLAGQGVAGALDVAPQTIDLGSAPVPAPGSGTRLSSAPRTVTLSNKTGAAIPLASIETPDQFTQTNTCGQALAAHSQCTITVRFSPAVTGDVPLGTRLTVTAGDGQSYDVALQGTGSPAGLTLTPSTFDFGAVKPGASSAPLPVTISNNTGGGITNFAVTASGEYSATGDCGATLAQGASCTMQVVMTPATTVGVTGSLYVTGTVAAQANPTLARLLSLARTASDTSGTGPAVVIGRVALSGSGDPGALDLSASRLTFASQATGTSSAAQTVTITNTGGSGVTGLAVTSTPDFPETTTCGATLAAGATCTASVTFTPTASGARDGRLSLVADGGLSPYVALSGTATGGQLSVNPSSLSFAARALGTSSLPQTLTFANTGTATLHLQSLTIAGAGFALSNSTCGTLPATLAPQASCTTDVTFSPTQTAAVAGGVTAASDAGTAFAGLAGSGNGAALTLSASSFSFGSQGVGLTSAAQTLTLANASGGDIPVASITTTGDFAQTNNCGTSVAAGGSCAVQITYTPTAAGAATGTVTVSGDGQTHTAALTGTGVNFTLALGAGQASNLTLNAGGSTSFPVTLTPGGFSGPVSITCSGLPAASTCTVNPSPVTLTAGGAATTVTVTIATRSRGVLVPVGPLAPPAGPNRLPWLWFALAAALASGAVVLRRRQRLAFGLLLLGAITAAACGGVTNELNANGGTPPGTYTATVKATAGKASQTVNVTVSIN